MQSRDHWSRFLNGSYAGVNAVAAHMSQPIHRRLRAPQEDGAALIEPPLAEAVALIQRNRTVADNFRRSSGFGETFFHKARAAVLDPPRLFTERAKNLDTNRPIIATGHQPELYHAGVWF